jgi:signal transduction histidine kinase
MSTIGHSHSELVDIDGVAAPVRELTPVTLRVIKHDLRTPINHIIGYSEMLIEDLDARSDAAALTALRVVLDAGKEMLAVVNAHVGAGSDPESFVSSDVLASLRLAIGASVSRVCVAQLEGLGLDRSATFTSDVRKMLDATRHLAEFARTGELPAP